MSCRLSFIASIVVAVLLAGVLVIQWWQLHGEEPTHIVDAVGSPHKLKIVRPTLPSAPLTFSPATDSTPHVNQVRLRHLVESVLPFRSVERLSVHALLHALRLWGDSLNHPNALSSEEMLSILIDNERFNNYYATNHSGRDLLTVPLLSASPLGFSVRLRDNGYDLGGEPHVDTYYQVMGELGISRSRSLFINDTECQLSDGISETIARFNIAQEIEFTTVALAHYLPPERRWINRHGQEYSFDDLAERLLAQEAGTCYNTHRLYALVILLRANEQNSILRDPLKLRVESTLSRMSHQLGQSQLNNGLWNSKYSPEMPQINGQTTEIEQIVCTSHHLEWISLAPVSCRPEEQVIQRAANGLLDAVYNLPPSLAARNYGPLTHAARALCLLVNMSPVEVLAIENGRTSSSDPEEK